MWRGMDFHAADAIDEEAIQYSKPALYFTVKLLHGGFFTELPNRKYVEGEVDYFDFMDRIMLGLDDISEIVKKIGYGEGHRVYYCIPGSSLDDGIRCICDRAEIKKLLIDIEDTTLVEMYVVGPDDEVPIEEHIVDEDGGWLQDEEDSSERDPDYLHDSDYASSDEDLREYEKQIDKNVEAAGWLNIESSLIKTKTNGSTKHVELDDSESSGKVTDIDYASASELESICNSSDEEDNRKKKKAKFFDPDRDMENPQFYKGLCFPTKEALTKAIRMHGIMERRAVKLKKNDKIRVRAKCVPGCPWQCYARKVPGELTFEVRTYCKRHTCSKVWNTRCCNSNLVSDWFVDDFRDNPEMTVSHLRFRVQKEKKLTISKSQGQRAKQKALTKVIGKVEKQFAQLEDYILELYRTNPSSTIVLKTEDDDINRFKRIYICWGATKRGVVDGCRKLIGLDGCHLKGPCSGQLLTAVGIDGNDSLYPVAYAVVEVEDKDSWRWFLALVIDDLNIEDNNDWVIITDKQKGLCPAVYDLLPKVQHRHCVMHLYNNFKKENPGLVLRQKMWKIAKATYEKKFTALMQQLKEDHEKAYTWLCHEYAPCWTRWHFKTATKCDLLVNNLCESFNSRILSARNMPILGMLEWLRIYMTKRMEQKRSWMRKHDWDICPKIQKKIEEYKDRAAGYSCMYSGDGQFQINCSGNDQFVVDLKAKTCSCRKWDLTGIPCAHAIRAISDNREPISDYLSHYYTREMYLYAYDPVINPINGPDMWPSSDANPVLPPHFRPQPGRPKRARRKDPDSPVKKSSKHGLQKLSKAVGKNYNKCGNCKKVGHNKKTCPELAEARAQEAAQRAEEAARREQEATEAHEQVHAINQQMHVNDQETSAIVSGCTTEVNIGIMNEQSGRKTAENEEIVVEVINQPISSFDQQHVEVLSQPISSFDQLHAGISKSISSSQPLPESTGIRRKRRAAGKVKSIKEVYDPPIPFILPRRQSAPSTQQSSAPSNSSVDRPSTSRVVNIRYPPTRTKEAIKYMKSYWHCYLAPGATIPKHPLVHQEDSDSD